MGGGSNNENTSTTTTTTTETIPGQNIVLGNFSLKEFDNLLSLLEGSPDALGMLNLDAFNSGPSANSPLKNINLDNLVKPETETTTTTIVERKILDQNGNVIQQN